jgi:hypothetical protein
MARPTFTDTLIHACPAFANLRAACSPVHTTRAEDRIAGTHALTCPTCQPIVQRLKEAQAVRDLTTALAHPVHDGDYWLTHTTTGRHSLIAPVTGRLVWLALIAGPVVRQAEGADLITLGPIQPMPEYRGGQRHRWQVGQQGHVVTLAEAA